MGAARPTRSRLSLKADSDHARLAGLLRRAHTIAIDTGVAPRVVRPVISDSWRRSVAAGVDPERPAQRVLDPKRTAERLALHPVGPHLPRVTALLHEALVESGYFVAFSDVEGVLLWTDGPSRALQSAVAPRFLPGFLCSEEGVGTNAIGTALALDQPVQIFSAEHFSRLLHGWTCAAAPVHDPDTGEVLGALDLSGDFRTAHVHGLPLVTAVAMAVEAWLAAERSGAERLISDRFGGASGSVGRRFSAVVSQGGRVVVADPPGWIRSPVRVGAEGTSWSQRDGTTIEAEAFGDGYLVWRADDGSPLPDKVSVALSGRARALVTSPRGSIQLSLRHSEILALLAANPAGMMVRDLALGLYGSAASAATVRAEVRRLRRRVGPDVVLSRPYRLHERVAVDLHGAGPRGGRPLQGSRAPGIEDARCRLCAALGDD
jgi:transcriptional regulator of acetoin/glycerol metabolism